MSSCVRKILFKSEQICGCCCKMLRGSLFWDTRYIEPKSKMESRAHYASSGSKWRKQLRQYIGSGIEVNGCTIEAPGLILASSLWHWQHPKLFSFKLMSVSSRGRHCPRYTTVYGTELDWTAPNSHWQASVPVWIATLEYTCWELTEHGITVPILFPATRQLSLLLCFITP